MQLGDEPLPVLPLHPGNVAPVCVGVHPLEGRAVRHLQLLLEAALQFYCHAVQDGWGEQDGERVCRHV